MQQLILMTEPDYFMILLSGRSCTQHPVVGNFLIMY